MSVPVSELTDSRAATDALLQTLRTGRWRPGAVGRFLCLAAHRSVRQAARRPSAFAQAGALHGLLFTTARAPGARAWVATSWTLTVLHLGLLEDRARLSSADVLTLLRCNLPATALGHSRWSGLLAIALDLADGRLARHHGTVSPFGDYADSLADAAFWTWLVLRHEPSPAVRAAALAAWTAPVVTVTAVSMRRGSMPDRPRPVLLRPAAALQAVVAVRHLVRR
ncbi:CDP-alcohol phosphatidyltransferase family protein [Streptomyces sp. TRM68367]|uniref:CDP-alcohol phosphatidyltransferase family protein n=1 Tax=Streptomyces sp. TRM68367 TaxID=2758415 RepID=UPI00165B51F8|nr:CDP-alcohol phosphatidyltransferase family protein [Streptomyces sp. TRM68367]MBC9730085.1 CDP-alcohol phosphatidyltransferase family protein [Streptomyces sp. TRM68367]